MADTISQIRAAFHRKSYLFFLGPSLIIMGSLTLYPMVYGIKLSLTRYNLVRPWIPKTFVGLKNFTDFFSDEYLVKSLWVTFKFAMGTVALQVFIGLLVALVLHQILKKTSLLRFMVLLPMLIVPVVTGIIWRLILNDTYGVLNWIIQWLGIAPQLWLGPDLALITVIIVETWAWLPFSILLFSLGLSSIPEQYYEAAAIDGAGPWRTFFTITLPNLRWTLFIVLVFKFSDALKAFDTIYTLTGGGPGIATRALALYVQNRGFTDFEIGYAMALSILVLTISFIIIGPFISRLDKQYE